MFSTVIYVAICLAFTAAIPYLNHKPSGLEKLAAFQKPSYNVEVHDVIYLEPHGTVSLNLRKLSICSAVNPLELGNFSFIF